MRDFRIKNRTLEISKTLADFIDINLEAPISSYKEDIIEGLDRSENQKNSCGMGLQKNLKEQDASPLNDALFLHFKKYEPDLVNI